jgi:D-xylose transport system substrate-binding protein
VRRPAAFALLAAALAVLAGCGKLPQIGGKQQLLVGLSLADLKEERWKKDRDLFTKEVEALGGRVLVQDAGGDARVQIDQSRNLLLRGVRALVVIPKNADAAAPIVLEAHRRKVPVVSYDRLIANADPDLYVSFDNYRVGEIQASEILKRAPTGKYLLLGGDPADQNSAMLREGQRKVLIPPAARDEIVIVGDPYCDKWLRAEATRHTEDALVKHPDLAAVVASNDGTAGGAIAALAAKGLAGKVLVSGQDADLEACRNLVRGLQAVTVYKPIHKIAKAAAAAAVLFARGRTAAEVCAELEAAGAFGGRFTELPRRKHRVPTLFLEPIPVTKENLDATVIADGFHKRSDVYTGPGPEGTR